MNNTDSKMGGLISLGGNLEHPRDCKASDFPMVGPSGAAGEASGAGKLIVQTVNQEGPRHTQDDGSLTPSVWGKADGFTVGKAKSGATTVASKCSVDLQTGEHY